MAETLLAIGAAAVIFTDGFESGDLGAWALSHPAPEITCLTLSPATLTEGEVTCSFDRPGVYAVRLEVCNELGCDEAMRLVEVLDPAMRGACCLRAGSCRDARASECGFLDGDWSGYGTRCREVACAVPPPPPPDPIFEAQGCLLGFCVFPVGTTLRFRQSHLVGPFRYGFESGENCQLAPGSSPEPVTEHTYRVPGSYRPCMSARNLAGDRVVVANSRPIRILEEDP